MNEPLSQKELNRYKTLCGMSSDAESIKDITNLDAIEEILIGFPKCVAEIERLKVYLKRAGWGPCNIPACNCDGWHHLRESEEEIEAYKQAALWKAENESRAILIKKYHDIIGYNNSDGFHSEPSPEKILLNWREQIKHKLDI